jgi:hypothetical protein
MRIRIVAIDFDGLLQKFHGFPILSQHKFAETVDRSPHSGNGILRTKTECLLDVRLSFLSQTDKNLGDANHSMSAS